MLWPRLGQTDGRIAVSLNAPPPAMGHNKIRKIRYILDSCTIHEISLCQCRRQRRSYNKPELSLVSRLQRATRICCRAPASAAIDRYLLQARAQQQTRRTPLLLPIDGQTEGRRTDIRPLHRPSSAASIIVSQLQSGKHSNCIKTT